MLKKQLLFTFAIILLVTSCKKEEVSQPQLKDSKIEMAQRWFENQPIKLPRGLFKVNCSHPNGIMRLITLMIP